MGKKLRISMGSKKKNKSIIVGTNDAGPSQTSVTGAVSSIWFRSKPAWFVMIMLCVITLVYFLLLLRETKSIAQFRASFKFQVPGLNVLRSSDAQGTEEGWVRYPVTRNETRSYLDRLGENSTSSNPCIRVRTHRAHVFGFPDTGQDNIVRLSTGTIHTLTIVSFSIEGQRRCAGGDYFETDLSGPHWKSRPPVIDVGDGSYDLKLQVDRQFPGRYRFKVILLYANFHGLHLLPMGSKNEWVRDETVADFEIEFFDPEPNRFGVGVSSTKQPGTKLRKCGTQDFKIKQWSGRWTREQYNRTCTMEQNGRYICLDLDTPCDYPWCVGRLGRLESNGWVYSAHCSFRIFTEEEAWDCLDGKWILWWGDSSHLDTARNLLNFVLGSELNNPVTHNFDRYFYRTTMNPQKPSEGNRVRGPQTKQMKAVRISSVYVGFDPALNKYPGLSSVMDPKFQDLMDMFFNNATASPDFLVLNSGVDDAFTWTEDLAKYVHLGAETAAKFWKKILLMCKTRVIFRHSVATAGLARRQSINPQKLEIYNSLLVEALMRHEIPNLHVVDNFDLSFPWHFNHECSDGPHYGRPPLKATWIDGRVGHQYFVDLMLGHILLNAMCSK